RISAEQERPEKKRAFLASPQRSDLIDKQQRAVAVLRHIGEREIIAEEEILDRADRKRDEKEDGETRIARALDEQRTARDDSSDSGAKGVDGGKEREQQSKRTDYIHQFSSRASSHASWGARVGTALSFGPARSNRTWPHGVLRPQKNSATSYRTGWKPALQPEPLRTSMRIWPGWPRLRNGRQNQACL